MTGNYYICFSTTKINEKARNMKRKRTAIFLLAAALLPLRQAEACTNILVSKGASRDGSTMVTYTADSHQLYGCLYFRPAAKYAPGTMMPVYEWDTGRYLGEIPQAAETYSVIGNMNEHQLVIAESTFGGRHELVDTIGLIDYGTLIYTTLQRARTAREAIAVMNDLVTKYGYCSEGESFSIADPNEVWHMEMVGKGVEMKDGANVNRGAVWVAVKVPDGYISMHANQARITQFPLDDPQNCLYSPDLIAFAKSKGLYKGPDKGFSFAEAFAPADFSALRACEARVWSTFNRVTRGAMEKYLDYAMGHNRSNRMPLFVKPVEKLSAKEVMWLMRDHYEDTPLDMRNDIGAGGHNLPYRWRPMTFTVDGQEYVNERAIATQQTGFWFVSQSRSWLAARRDRRIAVVRSRRLGHIVPDADLYQLDARAGMLPRRQRPFDRILDHVGFLAFQPRDEFRLFALRPHKRGHQTGDPRNRGSQHGRNSGRRCGGGNALQAESRTGGRLPDGLFGPHGPENVRSLDGAGPLSAGQVYGR